MKISWIEIEDRIDHELQQCLEEGHDISHIRNEWRKVKESVTDKASLLQQAEAVYKTLETISTDDPHEPSDWESIVRLCQLNFDAVPSVKKSFVEDRILGGWLGRSAGCLLGKPVEKINRTGIRELLSSNDTWPMSDYITGRGIPDELLKKYPWNRHYGKESLKENIECMPEDDDMNYPMLNLTAAEKHGDVCTSEQILQTWLERAPVLSTFTAERIAYVNRLNGFAPPVSAIVRNPYREWIGAQIRADFWGWISPGQPARSAEMAFRDARISHVRNGIYGEIFFAAAIAAAFHHDTVSSIIREALKFVPPDSRFAAAIQFVMAMPAKQSWETTVDMLYEKFGSYHWVHTINNAALVTAALLSSDGDYERAITNVVMGGWDTDSNGATVGSVMGTMLGAKKLPAKWIAPLHDTIRSSIKGFDRSSLTSLAERTASMAQYLK